MRRETVLTFLLTVVIILLVAMPVLAYTYQAPYAITEENGNSYSMLAVTTSANDTSANNQWMADNGFMKATALDTRIETLGGLAKPHMVADNRTLTAVPVPADSQTNLYFSTGNSDLTSMDIITGYDGYITVADNATLELGDNFTIEQSGWVDTSYSANKTLVYKEDAFVTLVSATGNITSGLCIDALRPTGVGSETAIPSQNPGGGAHWDKVDETTSDGDTTYVAEPSGDTGYFRDLYSSTSVSSGVGTITGVEVKCKAKKTDANLGYVKLSLRTHAATYDGGEENLTTGYVTYNKTWADNPSTNTTWTWDEVTNLEIGVNLFGRTSEARCTQVWAEISGDVQVFVADVTATGVSSGAHTVKTDIVDDTWLEFDGVSDNVDCGNDASLRLTQWTYSMWFQRLSDSGAEEQITGKSDAGDYDWALYIGAATDKINFVYKDTGATARFMGNLNHVIALDTWYYLATTFDGTYIRGYLEPGDYTVVSANLSAYTPRTSTKNMFFATRSSNYNFNGIIDEVTFYNRALGQSEIDYNYSQGRESKPQPQSQTGLVAWWHIDEYLGGTTYDETANSNNGTINGASWDNERLKLYIDDVEEDSSALSVNVTDNANDWILGQNNAMPYMDYYKHTVNGTLIAWYQPNTMISGTTLPDREGTAQNGVITFGSNPAGVSVLLSGLVSSSQPLPGQIATTPTRDILPTVEVTDWFKEPDVSGTLLTNPLRPFVTIMSDTTTLTELQSWRLLAFAMILLVTVSTAMGVRGHHAITGIAAGVSILGAVVLTIFPMWALVFTGLFIISGLIAERSPSL